MLSGALPGRLASLGWFFNATCAFIVASLLLGGGTGPGFLSDTIVQLLAVPLLLAGMWRYLDLPPAERPRWTLALCALIAAVPVVQLVPLPPRLWTSLPGREALTASLALLQIEPAWAPISVSPTATWLSLISLLPPVSVFLAVALLGYRDRRNLSLVILSFGAVSVVLGLSQVAQGPASPLRFFANTNPNEAVGFFANRNHFAALLYILVPLAAAWTMDATIAIASAPGKRRFETEALLPVLVGFTLLLGFVATQVIVRSRAGIGLAIIALVGALVLAVSDRRAVSGATPLRLVLGALALIAVVTLQFALARVLERYTTDPLGEARISFARNTIEAAMAFFPLGSGMGTFIPVYAMFEKPGDVLPNAFANHAHNDFLELWLEAGVLAAALAGLCGVWLVWRSLLAWRRSSGTRPIDTLLARAASIAIGLLIAHSIVDYPLRTAAIMTTMAFLCALLIPAPTGAESAPALEAMGKTSRQRHAPGEPTPAFASPVLQSPAAKDWAPEPLPSPHFAGERWGGGLDWPEEWRKTSGESARQARKREEPSRD